MCKELPFEVHSQKGALFLPPGNREMVPILTTLECLFILISSLIYLETLMRTENKHHLIENKDFNMQSLLIVTVDTIKGNFTKMYIIKKLK